MDCGGQVTAANFFVEDGAGEARSDHRPVWGEAVALLSWRGERQKGQPERPCLRPKTDGTVAACPVPPLRGSRARRGFPRIEAQALRLPTRDRCRHRDLVHLAQCAVDRCRPRLSRRGLVARSETMAVMRRASRSRRGARSHCLVHRIVRAILHSLRLATAISSSPEGSDLRSADSPGQDIGGRAAATS